MKLIRPTLEGDGVLIDVLTPGDLFGSAAALGHATYPYTAHTLTVACALSSISARDFRAVLVEYPQVALAVLDDVTQRLEQAHTTVRRLASGTVEHRVASTLLALADKVGEPRGEEILLQLPLTRPDLAAMTGTTTESVSRTLSRLRRAGVIATGRRWISITDRGRLAESCLALTSRDIGASGAGRVRLPRKPRPRPAASRWCPSRGPGVRGERVQLGPDLGAVAGLGEGPDLRHERLRVGGQMRGAPVGEVAHVRVPALVQGDQVLELAQHVEGAALVALTGPYRRARGLGGVVGRHGASPCEEMRNGDVGRMPTPW